MMRNQLKTICRFVVLALAVHQIPLDHCSAEEIALGHFGSNNYGDWTSTGIAFNLGPASHMTLKPKTICRRERSALHWFLCGEIQSHL
jgi:hypothetical protein